MEQTKAFWKLVFLALALTAFFVFTILVIIWHQLDDLQIKVVSQITYDNIYYILAIITVVPVSLWVVFEICYTRFYLPLKKIPSETTVIYQTNPSYRLELEGNYNIEMLTRTVNNFADVYENLTKHIAQEVTVAREETERERNLLASIMAELPEGIVICNKNGRILLFNSQSRLLLTTRKFAKRPEYFLGLGRSIYHIIDRSYITNALEEIEERLRGGKKRAASYFTIELKENLLIQVETIPVLDQARQITGFILGLQDLSASLESYDTINTNLADFERELNSQRKALEKLVKSCEALEPDDKGSICNAFSHLKNVFETTRSQVLDSAFEIMPLTKLELKAFLFTLQKTVASQYNIRINVFADVLSGRLDSRFLGDMYSLTAALSFFLWKLSEILGQDDFDLLVGNGGKRLTFILSWGEGAVPCSEIDRILGQKFPPFPTLEYVLKQNKTVVAPVPGLGGQCRKVNITSCAELPLPFPGVKRSPIYAGSRPEFYDFNLFSIEHGNQDLLSVDLRALTYSVIDTETTGLNPERDEIISIGAVRIVNSRIVLQECYEQLVNPGRDIPFESYKIHGIDSKQVGGMPTLGEVLPRFRRYVSETVLLGHDVAFDLKMLRMKEKQTGIVFNNPVLDTLLLSAMLHPIHKQHNIESIARRLGVKIVGRHTALGDATATAEIFLKLIPILQSKGVVTLQDAVTASKRTYFLRLRY